VPRGAHSPLFYLRHFFARCLTLVPRSLLLNRMETLATQAMADRESSAALCHGVTSKKKKGLVADRDSGVALWHGVALKKKKIGRGSRERCVSFPRFGIDNALQGRKERNSKGVWERAESRGLCCFNYKTRTIHGMNAHSSVLHWTVESRGRTVL